MSKFGIKKDLQAKAGIPISAPLPIDKPTPLFSKGFSFPLAVLESVKFDPAKKSEDRQTKEITESPVLEMVFRDHTNPEKKITSIRYPLNEDDDTFDIKHEGLTKSIKHIFEEAVGEDKFDEDDFSADSYAELFEKTAKAFAKYTVNQTKKGKDGAEDTVVAVPIYKTKVFYLKLTYFNSRLSPPMFPNFLQPAFKTVNNNTVQVPCELSVLKKDAIVDKSNAQPASGGSGREGSFGLPAGGSAFGMPMDMGNIPNMDFPDN